MRIFLFIFVGIALGDKLDRTYLPPPGSKFSGGSQGALQPPLEYPKETYYTTEGIGPNDGPTFASKQGPGNTQQSQQGFPPSGLQSTNIGGPTSQGQQQQNLQGFTPQGQTAFGNSIPQQQPSSQGFVSSGPQTPRATFGPGNLQLSTPNFVPSSLQQPAFGSNQGSANGQLGSQAFIQNNQQPPNAGPTFGPNQRQSQLNSQGFEQPGPLPNFQQSPFSSSTQSPFNNFQNNVPSTTTSYAFTQTTILPFDDVSSTGPPFGFNGQQPYDIPVQVNYPQNGLASDQTPVFQQTTGQNNGVFPQQQIAGQNQPTVTGPFSQLGLVMNKFANENVPFSKQGTIGQTQPSYNSSQNMVIGLPNQPSLAGLLDTNLLQQQKYSQPIFTGPSSTQQGYLNPGSGSEPSFPQTGGQNIYYQPSRIPSFQQGIPSTTAGPQPQFGGNFIQPSSFPERQSQNQQQEFNNNVQPTQQSVQTQYSTPESSPQRTTQRPNQYQNQYGPVTSTTASSFDQDYSTPTAQNIGGIGDNTQARPGFSTPGMVAQSGTPGNFISSTASSISPDIYLPSTPIYTRGQKQEGSVQNKPVRFRAESDRNAVILNYENNLAPNGEFNYSFDTSNGIHADENGTSIDGVKAQGSFSYTGDDGKVYSVTYSADENGFVPMGDHLPTPPPIPDAIKRVIEQAKRDKEAGIFNDGSYDDTKYGYNKYKGKMDRYIPESKYFKKNKTQKSPGQEKPVKNLAIDESDNEDNVDYETLQDEIDDIRPGNKKQTASNISGPKDSLPGALIRDHTLANKITGSKSNDNFQNTDDGYESDDEQTTDLKNLKRNQLRPSEDNTETTEEDNEYDIFTKTPKSHRQRPSGSISTVQDEGSGTDYEKKRRPQASNSDRRLEMERMYASIMAEFEDNKEEKQKDNNKRRPSLSLKDYIVKNVDVDTNITSKRPKPSNRKHPSSSTSMVHTATVSGKNNQYQDSEDETQKLSKRPLHYKSKNHPESSEEGAEEGIEIDFEYNTPLKRPYSDIKQPNVRVKPSENSDNNYDSKKPSEKPELNSHQQNMSGDTNEISRKPANRRPAATVQSIYDSDELDRETDAPKDGNPNIFQPYDVSFGDRDETLSKPDKITVSKLPSKSNKVSSNNFKTSEEEDKYDYSLNEETDKKSTETSENKNRGPQRKKPINTFAEEEVGDGDDSGYLDQEKPVGKTTNKNKQGQKTRKPTGSQTISSQEETNIEDHDTAAGFDQSLPSSTPDYLYSSSKPFKDDGKKGYQYLPPQRKFDEQPVRIPFSQSGDINLPNQGFLDRNRQSDFESTSSTIGPEFGVQQSTSRPISGNLFEMSSPQNGPNYYNKDSEQNVTPSPFAPSQTQSKTDATRHPIFGQTSQGTPSQITQHYPVTERNRNPTPGLTPERFSTSTTPGFSSTYGPTASTQGIVYGNRYSTTPKPFGPNTPSNTNYYSKARPMYRPSFESPNGSGKQMYPSGNVPSTTYRPNNSITTTTNYDPTFGPNQQEYEQKAPSTQRPIYGPGSTPNDSDRNVYTTDGPKYIPSSPNRFPQGSRPNEVSSTDGFGIPIGFGDQENGFGPQRPTGNGPLGFNKVIGEDFSGPKRPQTYDPESGYNYK